MDSLKTLQSELTKLGKEIATLQSELNPKLARQSALQSKIATFERDAEFAEIERGIAQQRQIMADNEKYADTVYNDGAGLSLDERETVRSARQAYNQATRALNRLQARQKHIQNEINRERPGERADFAPPRPSPPRLPIIDKSSAPRKSVPRNKPDTEIDESIPRGVWSD